MSCSSRLSRVRRDWAELMDSWVCGTVGPRAEVLILFPGSGNVSGGHGPRERERARAAPCGRSRADMGPEEEGVGGAERGATLLT